MRTVNSFLLIWAMLFAACGNRTSYIDQVSSNYYPGNEDKFGFLVFDKERVDSFFRQYPELNFQSDKLQKAFKGLLRVDTNFRRGDDRFTRHISPPASFDKQLAFELLEATVGQHKEEYFTGSLNYLFFYKCLPDTFKANWPQVQLGDLQFNVTFFNLLRVRCEAFEKQIVMDSVYWDENIKKVFGEETYNEFTVDKVQLISHCIRTDTAFADPRLQPDKDNFLYILDQVIARKWRLILMDNN
ncbi:hypothetical protein D3H65_30845 [Paraflavitalea soli]|uniref:Lipoprotein n=1 Tax=Paraflavitalea soli TaxID=2315862 RepID=A0A3B7MYH8_9BACT|nr:hypothetical protein [Paraflavitalea soli]AXY78126.1 hypothetical protein D3H65_30845 [Paraflavitalea soli]